MTNSGEPVDAVAAARHAGSVGEKPAMYWDYRECCWVPYVTALEDIPRQLLAPDEQPTPVATTAESDIRSG